MKTTICRSDLSGKMIRIREGMGLTQQQMAHQLSVSVRLIRWLEEDESGVTAPGIAERVGKAYGLNKQETLLLMRESGRPGHPKYVPDKYRESVNLNGLSSTPFTASIQPKKLKPPARVRLSPYIRVIVKGAGVTQAQIAKQLGIHASTTINYINGYASVKPETARKLAKLLGVDVKEIYRMRCRMTDEAKLIVNTLRACAVETQCSKCVVLCGNDECLFTAAAKMIESLSAKLEHAGRERDALLEDLRDADQCVCSHCKHYKHCLAEEAEDVYEDHDHVCSACGRDDCPCKTCAGCSNWEWRGIQNDLTAMKGE